MIIIIQKVIVSRCPLVAIVATVPTYMGLNSQLESVRSDKSSTKMMVHEYCMIELLWVHILLPGYPPTNTRRVPTY